MTAVFLKLFNLSVAAGWVVLAVLFLRLCLKKSPRWITCVLWSIVALRLLIPFYIESPFGIVPTTQLVLQSVDEVSTKIYVDSGVPSIDSEVNDWLLTPVVDNEDLPVKLPQTDASGVPNHSVDTDNGGDIKPPVEDEFEADDPIRISKSRAEILLSIAVPIWFAGIVLMMLYELVSTILVRRRILDAVLVRDNVWKSDRVQTTFIFGFLRPRIYVPSGLNEDSLDLILAHEHSHLQRLDHWVKPLAFTLLAVYWYNPLLWIAYILLCRDIEEACDERVVKSLPDEQRRLYAAALLKCGSEQRSLVGCPLAFGELSIKKRIFSVMSYRKPLWLIIVASIMVCLLAAACLLTVPQRTMANEWNENISVGATTHTSSATTTTSVLTAITSTASSDSTTNRTQVIGTTIPSANKTQPPSSKPSDPAHIHEYGAWRVVVAPECTTDGRKERTCACGYIESKRIAAVGHTYIKNVCVTCGAFNGAAFVPDYSPEEANVVGNVLGSFNVAGQGDWLYFAADSCRIMKCRTDGSGIQTIWSGPNGTIQNINIVGDWVYFFVKANTSADSYVGKVRTDGDGFAYVLPSVNIGEMLVVKDKLLFTIIKSPYSDYGKDAAPLYTMPLSGGMTKLLHDGYVSNLASDGNYLYFKYAPESGNKSVYRINMNTFARSTLISTFKAGRFVIKEGRIYYAPIDENTGDYIIKSAAVTGGTVTNHGWIADYPEWLCVVDNCLYYYGKPYGDELSNESGGIIELDFTSMQYRAIYEVNEIAYCAGVGDCLVFMDYVGSTLTPIRIYDPQTSQWVEIRIR